MIDTSLFPYETFPYRLEFGEKKDITICWFECDEHLQKYLKRYKLDSKKVNITHRDGKPTQSSQTNKNKVRSGTGKTNRGSTTESTRNTKNVDSSGNTTRTRKPKAESKPKPKPKPKPKAESKPKPKPKPKAESKPKPKPKPKRKPKQQ